MAKLHKYSHIQRDSIATLDKFSCKAAVVLDDHIERMENQLTKEPSNWATIVEIRN